MTIGRMIQREMVSLLRGGKVSAYLCLVSALSIAFVFMLATRLRSEYPWENMMSAGPFLLILLIFCLVLFASDAFSGERRQGNAYLQLLVPSSRSSIILSKISVPVIFYLIGITIFSLLLAQVPSGTMFWKLYLARLLVDTLVFFSLLYLTVFISMYFRPIVAPISAVSLLLFFLFFSPYTSFEIPCLDYINPLAFEYDTSFDLRDGNLDSVTPVVVLIAIFLIFAFLSHVRIRRMEVTE